MHVLLIWCGSYRHWQQLLFQSYITAVVLHAYRISDVGIRDDAPRSSGHALKSISLLADRPPRLPLVPADDISLFIIQNQ